jgi:hypothetical protein
VGKSDEIDNFGNQHIAKKDVGFSRPGESPIGGGKLHQQTAGNWAEIKERQ